MNFVKLKNIIQLVPSVTDIAHGNEYIFTQKVKYILPSTNFELLGEQLVVGKDNKIGKCDLWLANVPNNFLLSLELKVGGPGDTTKQNFLQLQVFKYTDYMRYYFPENIVYGLGAYKCIKINGFDNFVKGTEMKFSDYIIPTKTSHLKELEILKNKIVEECLN